MSDKISLRNRDLERVERGLKVLSAGITDAGGLRKFDFDIDTYWDIVKNNAAMEDAKVVYALAEQGVFTEAEIIPGEKLTNDNRVAILEFSKKKEALKLKTTENVFIPLDAKRLMDKNQKFKIPADTMADLWLILDPETIPQDIAK